MSGSGGWSFKTHPGQALASGAASAVIRVPTHASRTGLANDAVSVANEETVFMIGIANVHDILAAVLQRSRAFALLPRSNVAIDTAVLATFDRCNGIDWRKHGFHGPGGRRGRTLHPGDFLAFRNGPTEGGMFATTNAIIPEQGLGTKSNGNLVRSAILPTNADDKLVLVIGVTGVIHFLATLGQDCVANATAHRTLRLHHLGVRGALPGDFLPLDGTFGILFVGHALLLALAEERVVDASHTDGRSGVDGANHEDTLELIVADESSHVRMISRQRFAVSFAELLLMRRWMNGETDGTV